MAKVSFAGETFNDDRMFVVLVAKCTVVRADAEVIETTIHHETAPPNHSWCLVTYRNTARYPATRVDHFDSREEAEAYQRQVEPIVPLVSLGGQPPRTPLSWIDYTAWRAQNALEEYDYRAMYAEDGANPREIILTRSRS